MTTAIHLQTIILPGGKIEVSAPELPPGKRANVFVVVEAEEPQEKRPVREVLANLSGHHSKKVPSLPAAILSEVLSS